MAEIANFFVRIGSKFDDKGFGKAKGALNKIRGLSVQMAKAGAIVGTAFAAGTLKAISEAAKFQEQMQMVATMLDTQTKDLLPKFKTQLLDLSSKYAESTETLSKGLYDILSAGIDSSKAMGVLESAAIAAKAGLTDTGTAADAITTIINSYGLAAEDAGEVSDWMFSIVKRGKTTFNELAPVIGRVSSLASSAGLDMDELGAALATMTKSGIRTDEAITSLRGVMTAFLKPTKQAKEAAEELGIELSANTLRTQGLLPVLEKMSTATENQQTAIFGNIRALAGMSTILKDTSVFYEDLEFVQNKAGQTQEAFDKITATVTFKIAKMRQTLQNLVVMFGDKLLPVLEEHIIPAIEEFSQNTEKMTGVVNTAIRTIQFLIRVGQGIKTVFDLLTDSITVLILTLKGLLDIAVDVFGTLGTAVKAFAMAVSGNFKGAKEQFGIFQDKIKEGVGDIKTNFEAVKLASEEMGERFIDNAATLARLSEESVVQTVAAETKKTNVKIEEVQKRVEAEKAAAEIEISIIDRVLAESLLSKKVLKESFSTGFEAILQGAATLEEGMGLVFENIKNKAIKEISDIMAAEAVKAFLNIVTGGVGGVVGEIGKLFGLQKGVRNFRGGMALVGEKGPELVKLPSGANVLSAGETRSQGIASSRGGTTYNVTVNVNQVTNVREARRQAKVVGSEFFKSVERSRRP